VVIFNPIYARGTIVTVQFTRGMVMRVNKVISSKTVTQFDKSPKDGKANMTRASPIQILTIRTRFNLLAGLDFENIKSPIK